MKNEKDTEPAVDLWEGSNVRLQNEIMDWGTQKTDSSLLSVCSLFPACEDTIYLCVSPTSSTLDSSPYAWHLEVCTY